MNMYVVVFLLGLLCNSQIRAGAVDPNTARLQAHIASLYNAGKITKAQHDNYQGKVLAFTPAQHAQIDAIFFPPGIDMTPYQRKLFSLFFDSLSIVQLNTLLTVITTANPLTHTEMLALLPAIQGKNFEAVIQIIENAKTQKAQGH